MEVMMKARKTECGYDGNHQEDQTAINEFLQDIDCLKSIEEMIGRIDLFDVLKISHYEIRHSNILAWLLDPNENHGLGDRVLRGIVGTQMDLPDIDYSSFMIKREWMHTDLIAVSREEKIVLCIENKIESDEHGDQLNSYLETIQAFFPDSDYTRILLYLTPDGKDASDPVNWHAISYAQVYKIIQEAFIQSELSQEANLIIRNYLNTIRRQVMKDNEDIVKQCQEIYAKHRKALDLIFENRPFFFIDGGSKEELEEREGYFVYQIKKGDNLSKIAKANRTTVEKIVKSNTTINDEDNITEGYYLYIPKE